MWGGAEVSGTVMSLSKKNRYICLLLPHTIQETKICLLNYMVLKFRISLNFFKNTKFFVVTLNCI